MVPFGLGVRTYSGFLPFNMHLLYQWRKRFQLGRVRLLMAWLPLLMFFVDLR